MKILMLTPELHPYQAGGVGVAAYYIHKLLASDPKHKVLFFATCPIGMRRKYVLWDPGRTVFIYLLPHPFESISYLVNVVRTLMVPFFAKRKLKVNVIHAHTAHLLILFPVYLMSVLGKTPFIITIHGSDISKRKNKSILKLLQKRLLKKASYVTCVSKQQRHVLVDEYGLEDGKAITIPNGYDDNLVPKRKARSFLGGDSKIVFVGRLEGGKDPLTMIQAFKSISIRHADVQLLIIGDGPLRKSMENLSKELDIANRVLFYGHLSHEKVMALLADSDICALTSVDEGLPISLVEAMALGKAIVATKVGGVPDLIEDGINGLLVPPRAPELVAGAIEELLKEPQLAQRIGETASKSAEEYSWRSIARKYEKVYEASALKR